MDHHPLRAHRLATHPDDHHNPDHPGRAGLCIFGAKWLDQARGGCASSTTAGPVGSFVRGAQSRKETHDVTAHPAQPLHLEPVGSIGGFPGFDTLFDQMSQMLTSAFREVPRISVNSWSPPIDIQEADQDYMVEADLPGVRPEDVTIDLQVRELRIVGEYGTAEQAGDQGEGETQRARRSGRFDYRITLLGDVNSESATANLEHGVLRLRLPKASTGTRQRIGVQAGPGNHTPSPRANSSDHE
jgi:HSP20 family protein